MKRNILMIALVISAFVAQGCEEDDLRHPGNQAVEKAFSAKYTGVTGIDWEKKGGYWVVDFRKDAKDMEAWFKPDGEWIRTETEIRKGGVPQNIMAALQASVYASYAIDDVHYCETPQRNYYYFELDSQSQDVELIITLDGAVEVVKIDKD